jgi:hypothetical protein
MVFDLIDAARYFERNPRDSYAKQEYDTQRDRLIAALIHEARQEGT